MRDSAFIDNKWCYNIVYYPRRKNELTFKGDFWVNDSTYAIKNINLEVTKSANINWVKEIYIEQDFDVVNDSVFLLKRDYMLSDFSFQKKKNHKGFMANEPPFMITMSLIRNNQKNFIKPKILMILAFKMTICFWKKNRLEELNKDESGHLSIIGYSKNRTKIQVVL